MPTPSTTSAAAAPAGVVPPPKPPRSVKDVTPVQGAVHEVIIPSESALDFLNTLDPQAPAGKLARAIAVQIAPKGELQFRISYTA